MIINNVNYHPILSTAIFRVKTELPRLLLVWGIFCLTFALIALGVFVQNAPETQNTLSQASTQSRLQLELKPKNQLQAGRLAELKFNLKLPQEQANLTGIQLVFTLPKAAFQQPQLNLEENQVATLAYYNIKETQSEYLIKLIIIGNQAGKPLRLAGREIPLLTIYATAKTAGNTRVTLSQQSMAIGQGDANLNNILDFPQSVELTIGPPTDTQAQTTISFPFVLQGLNKVAVSKQIKVWFEPIANELEPGGANPKKVELETEFVSQNGGWLEPKNPINLTNLVTQNPYRQRYQVFVKAPVSLRKKVGVVDIQPGNWQIKIMKNSYSSNWPFEPVLIGDFSQVESSANKIDILDITALKEKFTDLEVALNANNALFDVNHNGKVDILDIGLVMSNWQELFIAGD